MSKWKRMYDLMNQNGELEELFPEATGNFVQDKIMFIAKCIENEQALSEFVEQKEEEE